MKIREININNSQELKAFQNIYTKSFPEWERDNIQDIYKGIKENKTKLMGGFINQTLVGLYTLELYADLNYQLLGYLAVKENERGQGYGTKLCKNVIHTFKEICKQNNKYQYLLLEAEERQAIFYGKLGFKKIDVKYSVPCYDSDGSVAMSLMIFFPYLKLLWPTKISGGSIQRIINHLYINAYRLSEKDPRVVSQNKKKYTNINILNWP